MGLTDLTSVLGNAGEFLGAIAVVATLVYLARQIRQNSRNLDNATSWAINEGLATLNGRLCTQPDLADLWIRGRDDIDVLDPVERERFRTLVMDIVNLAVYVHNLETTQGKKPLHYDMASITGGYYQQYPGIRAVVDSAEEITPPELMRRFRDATPIAL